MLSNISNILIALCENAASNPSPVRFRHKFVPKPRMPARRFPDTFRLTYRFSI